MTETAVQPSVAQTDDGKIVCHIDNQRVHSIALHIKNNHADTWTVERYQEEFPDAPLLSDFARETLERRKAQKAAEAAQVAPVAPASSGTGLSTAFAEFHKLFDLGAAPAAMSSKGDPIAVTVLSGHDAEALTYLPPVDHDYVFNIDILKMVVIGLELNKPTYLWGFHGTGKTTMFEQAAARTRRPFIRAQHTWNMQESEVLGQWVVKGQEMIFQLGPLPMAMLNGWVYCADEYDVASPAVISLYQPVLEGKALIIKDAPPEFRRIDPHPQFRICATGNTNGCGDETGLYQGTTIQNAANYSRFAITRQVPYMSAEIEEKILTGKTMIPSKDAKNIVKVANKVREMFGDGKLSMTVSPRELLNAAQLGAAYGGNMKRTIDGEEKTGFQIGLEAAFANRLNSVDRKVVIEFMNRTLA